MKDVRGKNVFKTFEKKRFYSSSNHVVPNNFLLIFLFLVFISGVITAELRHIKRKIDNITALKKHAI